MYLSVPLVSMKNLGSEMKGSEVFYSADDCSSFKPRLPRKLVTVLLGVSGRMSEEEAMMTVSSPQLQGLADMFLIEKLAAFWERL